MNQALQSWTENPTNFYSLLDHVACGGSITAYCQAHEFPFYQLRRWIRADSERSRLFDEAMDDRDELIKEDIKISLHQMTMFDLRKLYTEDGRLKHPLEWPEEIARSVAKLEQVDYYEGQGQDREQVGVIKKVQFIDKLKAKELVGKMTTLFNNEKKQNAETLGDLIMRSMSIKPTPRTLLTGGDNDDTSDHGAEPIAVKANRRSDERET